MLAGSFLVEEAVPLSHVAVFGNSIAQNLVNTRRGHPLDDRRPVIDLGVPLLLLPAQLLGNSLGVLVGRVLPATGVELLACALLFFAAIKTLRTAAITWAKESAATKLDRDSLPPAEWSVGGGRNSGLGGGGRNSGAGGGFLADGSSRLLGAYPGEWGAGCSGEASGDAAHCGDAPAPAAPARRTHRCGSEELRRVALLCAIWVLFSADFFALRAWGGAALCTARHLSILGALYLAVPLSIAAAARLVRREQEARLASRGALLQGEIHWTPRACVGLPALGVLVGLVAGLLGLGGGELMAPLLLALGMLPQVASATSACMVLFTSSSDVAHYLEQGTLADPGYLGYVGCAAAIGFCAALLGRILALRLVKKLSHPSLLAFVLGGVLLVGLALLVTQMAGAATDWSIEPLCH